MQQLFSLLSVIILIWFQISRLITALPQPSGEQWGSKQEATNTSLRTEYPLHADPLVAPQTQGVSDLYEKPAVS
jgi:hypothetical protein